MKRTIQIAAVAALALCVSAAVPAAAQDELPTSPALERAIVVEEIEHEPRRAIELYGALADDAQLADALRRHAALRLGRAHAALGELEAARAALARAAQGDDAVAALARAALADPGQDEQRARLLRAEARRWIGLLSPRPNPSAWYKLEEFEPTRNLLWIGAAAAPEIVPEIVRELERVRAEGDPYGILTRTLAALLWSIGGPDAAAWLEATRTGGDVELRRLVADGLRGDSARTDAMVALAQEYLADPDPEGDVPILALGDAEGRSHRTWRRYDADAILALVDAPVPAVRAAALELIAEGFGQMRYRDDAAATLDRLVPALARALDDVDPTVGQAALEVLSKRALGSPRGRALLVERLPRLGPDFTLANPRADRLSLEEPAVAGLLPMLRAVGPVSATSASGRDRAVTRLVSLFLLQLEGDAVELALEFVRLGYDRNGAGATFIAKRCGAEQAERVCAAMVAEPALETLLDWLANLELPAACWPSLAEVERRIAARTPEGDWTEDTSDWSDDDRARTNLMRAMGSTGAPAAVAHLIEGLEARPTLLRFELTLQALLRASERRPETDVRDALLRAVLVEVPEPERGRGPQRTRQLGFARLVELGDPRPFELASTIAARGLEDTALGNPYPESSPFRGTGSGGGVGWLTLRRVEGDRALEFNGYDEATRAAIWDALLAQPPETAWGQPWHELVHALGGDWRGVNRVLPQRYVDPAPRVVEAVARRWAARAAAGADAADDAEIIRGLVVLLDLARREVLEDPTARQRLRELRAACLASPTAWVRRVALEQLPSELDEAGRQAVQAALSDPDPLVARVAFDRAFDTRQPVPRALFLRALQNPSSEMRTRAIASLAPLVDEGAVEPVKAALADPSSDVRIAACRFLGTQVDADSVPELLGALTDIEEQVRAAAAEALRAIRFYHDEKAHWDRVFAGTELSANGAAEALLKQAAPDRPRDVRLLAIRSLGALGVAETLPFLIEWTADPDFELASAARAAIARIHAQGD